MLYLKLMSFFLSISSPHTRCSGDKYPSSLLFGDPYIYEKFHGYSFQISPDSFFQVNTSAAVSLYEKVMQISDLSEKTTLLDLCCGTGTYFLFHFIFLFFLFFTIKNVIKI